MQRFVFGEKISKAFEKPDGAYFIISGKCDIVFQKKKPESKKQRASDYETEKTHGENKNESFKNIKSGQKAPSTDYYMNKTSDFHALNNSTPKNQIKKTASNKNLTQNSQITDFSPPAIKFEDQNEKQSDIPPDVDPFIQKHLIKREYSKDDQKQAFGDVEDIDNPRKYPFKTNLYVKKKPKKNLHEYMDDANIDFTGLERKRLKIDTLFHGDIFGCYYLQLHYPEFVKRGAPKVHQTNSYSVIVQSSECFVYKLDLDFFKFLLSYEKGPLMEEIMVRDVPNLVDNLCGRKNTLLTWLAFQDKVLGDIVNRKESKK